MISEMEFYQYHNAILGFFNFHEIYAQQVNAASDGDVFVEIGALFGRSTSFMARLIQESKKDIQLDVIDVWDDRGQPELHNPEHHWVQHIGGMTFETHGDDFMYRLFLQYMSECGVLDVIRTFKLTSKDASLLYNDESIDFIFLDAAHDYESVQEDIKLWYPKLKTGKVFAGHDYDWPGVKQAVDEKFGDRVQTSGTSWLVTKED